MYAEDHARELRLDTLAGVGVEQVFKRRSGIKLSEPLPSLYGAAVFKEITGQGRIELAKQLAQDDWVWGEGAVSAANTARVMAAVTSLYELDYIRAWDEVLNDLQFVSFSTVAQMNEALRILTGPTSPLRGILRVVSDNTSLVQSRDTAAATGALAEAKKKLSAGVESVIKPLQQAAGIPAVAPGAMVTAHFQPIRQLMAGEPGKAPIDAILQVIGDIQQQLGTLGPDVAGGNPLDILASGTFRSLLLSLQQQAAALPPGMRTLTAQIRDEIGDTVIADATGEIEKRYREEVVPACRALVEARYPFSGADNRREMTLAEFGTVFGYEGVFDKFFSDTLEKQVDASGRQWTMLPGAAKVSQGVLNQFQAARRLRDMFFVKGSQMPALAFSVTLGNLDASAKRFILQVDGQNTEVTQGPPKLWQLKWPGPVSGAAVATFEERFIDPPTLNFSGPWAWFRMVDAAIQPSPDPRRVVLRVRGQLSSGSNHRRAVDRAQQSVRDSRLATVHLRRVIEQHMQVGFYGKLPSHGDFLRRRVSDAFVDVWDGWLREGMAASRSALGERWLEVYLTSPAWRFVCGQGACGPAAVVGLLAPSVDRVGRYFPLTLVSELPSNVSLLAATSAAASFLDSAERLVIDTLAAEEIDFESFDERVVRLGDELGAVGIAPRVVLDPSAAALLNGDARTWQIPIGSSEQLSSVLEQLLSLRLSSVYNPLVLWWTEGSTIVAPSCLIAKGLPNPATFAALLDGSWAQHQCQSIPAHVEPDAVTVEDTLVEDATPLRFTSAAATDVGRVRGNNQDGFIERPEIGLWAVADGLGGHSHGEIASRMVCDALADFTPDGSFIDTVEAAGLRIQQVNDHLLRGAANSPS